MTVTLLSVMTALLILPPLLLPRVWEDRLTLSAPLAVLATLVLELAGLQSMAMFGLILVNFLARVVTMPPTEAELLAVMPLSRALVVRLVVEEVAAEVEVVASDVEEVELL